MLSWKEWLRRDYLRYWYVVLSLVIAVFGVTEFMRLYANPAGPLVLISVGLLLISIVALEVVGYILLWKRESPAGKKLVAFFSYLLRLEY